MSTQIVNIPFTPHAGGQQLVWDCKSRFLIVDAGRRWGKTMLATFWSFDKLGKPNAKGWWVSPRWQETLVGWRMFVDLIPSAVISKINRHERVITMINGSRIWYRSADEPQALRAEGLDFVIFDEASRIKRAAWIEAIRPALGDVDKIGRALFISTPSGLNWFYQLYLLGQIEGNEYQSFHFPSWLKPKHLWKIDSYGRTDWEVAKTELPERIFRQEYGAEFLQDLSTVFRNVDDAKKGILQPYSPEETYVAGADLGKLKTWTVIFILNSRGQVVAWDRFKQVSWPLQIERIVNLVKIYNAELLIDATGLGDPIYDFIRQQYARVKPYKITGTSKMPLIDHLAVQIERTGRGEEGISYPEELDILINELKVFGIEGKIGQTKYEAPSGFYDDCVIALALAAWLLKRRIPLSSTYVSL